MNFKDMLEKISQLSEATKTTDKGRVHTAEPGGYGRKYDTDEEGDEKKKDAPAAKRGRGRPKKGSDDSGEVKKYDFSAFGVKQGKDVKLPKHDKSKTTKHSLKEYFEDLDKALNEAEQITIEPAKQNTQVIKQGTKTLGTVSNPQLAAQIKQSIGKGEMSLAGKEEMAEEGDYSAKKARAGKDIGKQGKQYDESVDEAISGADIDANATRQYAQQIIDAIKDSTSASVISNPGNDGSVQIVVNPLPNNRTVGYLAPAGKDGATVKSLNAAIDPFYRTFRQKGWRFDQPVQGQFTIAVRPQQQGVAEQGELNEISSALANRAATKAYSLSNDQAETGTADAARAYRKQGDRLSAAATDRRTKEILSPAKYNKLKMQQAAQKQGVGEGVHTRLNTYRIKGQDLIDQLSIQDGAEVEMVGDDVAILVVDTITFPELASMASKLAQQGKIKAIAGHATRDITGKAIAVRPGIKYINAPSPRDPKPMAESDEDYSAKKARAGKDIGKPGKQFAKIAKSAAERYGSKERGEKVAGAVLAKLRAKTNEADQPPHDSLASPLTLEGKGSKPDFLDLDKDGNKKESMKKAAQDKKKVKEGMDHRLKSARHAGKAHALAKEAYNCRYDDMEEAKHYHEGYKEGLDECYGQMPIQGYVGETTPPATVPGMASQAMKQPAMEDALTEGNTEKRTASQWLADPKLDTQVMQLQVDGINITNTSKGLKGFADGGRGYPYPAEPFTSAKNPMYFKDFLKYVMGKLGDVEVLGFLQAGSGMANQAMKQPAMEDDLDEMDKGDWMKHKAKTTPGDTFKAFGQTFKDKEVTESPFAFEAWDKELNALLESKEDVSEGMSVSISKGQQGAPDSVTVSAQDKEAEALLGLIKQAGLGLFGGDEPNGYGAPQGDTPQHGGVDVVGDHDGMMALIKKVTGGEQGNADYADEEGREETCEVCHESSCGCDEGQEMVDEVESEDQMTYQVAEDNPPDSGAHDTEIEVQDTAQMNKSGAAYNPKNDVDEGAGGPEASEEPVEPMVSEESDEEEDDHAEKAGEKVTKDIEYDDKEDKKKGDKLDEWANDAGKKGTDTTFETDIEFMMNVISGGLNKRKQTGQTTIPVISSQLNRQVAHTTTDINESTDPVSEWKKLAGI